MSADARELLAGENVHDSGAADAGFHQHDAGRVGGDFADERGFDAERVGAHGGENFVCVVAGNDRDELAFVVSALVTPPRVGSRKT